MPPRLQRTLANRAQVDGRGYWTGREARVEFRPAPVDSGLYFVRDDQVGELNDPRIDVSIALRQPATRRTVLRGAGGAEVAMIEHVVAALAGLGIDNCEIGVTSVEMPGCDGSATPFVEAIDAAGTIEQEAIANPLVIQKPIRCGTADAWIEARPPIAPGLTVEYRLDYGHDSAIGRQWLVESIEPDAFRFQISPARTFLLESEAQSLRAQGLGTHVTSSDLLIFRDEPTSEAERAPIDNPLRYDDECVRHKILDVVGDLALAGRPVIGHIVAFCSGHRLNGDLVEELIASHPPMSSHRMSA